jgi:hypothetical protein
MLEANIEDMRLTRPARAGVYERVLAPLLILLVTLASLAVLVFLGSRSLSCVSHISAQVAEGARQASAYSIPGG